MSIDTADKLARQAVDTMYQRDACAQAMGITIERVAQGFARLRMTIQESMLNGHHTCHGGQLFSLADTAFAYACNSQGQVAVASSCSIDFIRPGFGGDELTATARLKYQGKKSGFYEVEIINQQGKTLAWFYGRAHRTGETLLRTMDFESQKGDQQHS